MAETNTQAPARIATWRPLLMVVIATGLFLAARPYRSPATPVVYASLVGSAVSSWHEGRYHRPAVVLEWTSMVVGVGALVYLFGHLNR